VHNKHEFETRKEAAEYIIDYWEHYKVCDGCDSIVTVKTHICPVCAAYRFDTNKKKVINMARELSKHDQRSLLYDDLF
jgi:rRNA maturation endonuclease Nob1